MMDLISGSSLEKEGRGGCRRWVHGLRQAKDDKL